MSNHPEPIDPTPSKECPLSPNNKLPNKGDPIQHSIGDCLHQLARIEKELK